MLTIDRHRGDGGGEWRAVMGQFRLDDLIVPAQQGLWQLYDAKDINDAGQILAWGYRPEEGVQPLLLEPVGP